MMIEHINAALGLNKLKQLEQYRDIEIKKVFSKHPLDDCHMWIIRKKIIYADKKYVNFDWK